MRNKFINNHLVNWNLGLDHAGIATQYIVEKKLNLKNQTREEIGKEKFQELIWTWKEEAEKTIIQQAHEFELLMDWEKSSFTMDLDYQLLVKKSFIKLYNDNLIYKELKITNWDVKFQTAISDLEVIEKEVDTVIYILEYKCTNPKKDSIKIATTRPETIFADTAVGVNPKDERYLDLHNETFYVPYTNKIIPLITDYSIDESKGTGAMKISPAHDSTDYKLGKKHKLDFV